MVRPYINVEAILLACEQLFQYEVFSLLRVGFVRMPMPMSHHKLTKTPHDTGR